MLGKHYRYLSSIHFPYSKDIFVKASEALGVEFLGAFDSWPDGVVEEWPGVRNILLEAGRTVIPKEEFEGLLKMSLAIVGLGSVYFIIIIIIIITNIKGLNSLVLWDQQRSDRQPYTVVRDVLRCPFHQPSRLPLQPGWHETPRKLPTRHRGGDWRTLRSFPVHFQFCFSNAQLDDVLLITGLQRGEA